MVGLWAPIINAESKYNPGVPDLSYVMNGDCETGWLELKQDESASEDVNIHIEPGQHLFMRTFASNIPVHFLIARRRVVYLISGVHHRELSGPVSDIFLIHHGQGFQREALRANLYKHLTAITKRKQ